MKYHLKTFGCQMNKSDSERISSLLESLGFTKTNKPEKADLIILNSCSVRQTAEDRIFGQINNFAKLKEKNPNLILVVTGCMPGRDGEKKFKKKMPALDLYFPISELENVFECDRDITWHPRRQVPLQTPYVPIQSGCNRFCSYCVVPYARGREKCHPLKEILSKAKNIQRVELLGQVVNNYIAPDPENFSEKNPYNNHFAKLLWEINQIPKIKQINFTSAHPIYMTDEVIDALTLPKQINYLHLAVQSGDNKILKKMNRPYTREEYLDIIKKIKKKKPNIKIGTDIIVGFPGEGEKEFQNTVDLCRQINFDIAYVSMYSPRSGTAAYNLKDDVPRKEKRRRWNELQKLTKTTYTTLCRNLQN